LETFINIFLGIHKDALAYILLGAFGGMLGTLVNISRRDAAKAQKWWRDVLDIVIWTAVGAFFSLGFGALSLPIIFPIFVSPFTPVLYKGLEASAPSIANWIVGKFTNHQTGGGNNQGQGGQPPNNTDVVFPPKTNNFEAKNENKFRLVSEPYVFWSN
jgi:hypothetical protein